VIKQGEFLQQLADALGFDADTVWQDPSNAQLQAIRPNANILAPGDVLYIPETPSQPPATLTPGSTNSFVASAPSTFTLTHKFVGFDPTTYASKAYTVQELDQLTGLQSDENGVVTFQAPVTLTTATVVFTDTGESWTLCIGAMDPINTLSGIFMRLQNLGYIGADVLYDPNVAANNLGVMRAGLFALKATQAGGAGNAAPSSAPASSPAPNSPPASSPSPPTSSPTASPSSPASGPASSPTPDSAAPSDPAPSSGAPGSSRGWCRASPPSDPPPSSGPASSPAASQGETDPAPASGPGSSPPAPASGPASSPPSNPNASGPPPSSGPASSPPSSPGAIAGLADNGTLDAETEELLRSAYGC
jgi:hypothetical protein